MPAPNTAYVATFCFKYGRFSWKENYISQTGGTNLRRVMDDANDLALKRIPLLGTDGSVFGSPYLDRILVSRNGTFKDVLVNTEFQTATPQLSVGSQARGTAPPFLAMEWKVISGGKYWAVRYMGCFPSNIMSAPDPANEPTFKTAFGNFVAELARNWGFVAVDRESTGSRDHEIWHMQTTDADHVKVYSSELPNVGDDVEIRNGRFVKGSKVIRGFFHVSALDAGSFIVDTDPIPEGLDYRSSAIWRKPVGIVVPIGLDTTLVGLTHHKRGFTLHNESGRRRPVNTFHF